MAAEGDGMGVRDSWADWGWAGEDRSEEESGHRLWRQSDGGS